ncbi:MAG: response regulator [Chloroflexi bacterium]|nr:response regulator [Chloroflexota bacterium]
MSNKSRILIVDDDAIIRETMNDLLSLEGYELAFAANGREALTQTAVFDPDLVLLDIMMPKMSGFEACQHLRADPKTAELPIILVTAFDDHDSRLRGIEAGADDFISKPYDSIELRARVRAITRLNRYRRLMAERTKFKRVVESAQDGYLLLNNKGEVLFTNAKAREYLGVLEDESEPILQTFLELAQRQYLCQPEDAWSNWPERPFAEAERYLIRPETPTAQASWLRVDVLVNSSVGAESTWLVSLRDITAQKVAQTDMLKFQGFINHKLNTPLSQVLGFLQLLEMDVSEQTGSTKMAGLVDMALQSAERLQRDIEGVLKHIEAPILAQSRRGFDLAQLEPLVGGIGATMNINWTLDFDPVEMGNAQLSLSPQAVESIFWEILDNAKKFHPHRSPIVQISVRRPNSQAVNVMIKDDGASLSFEQLARVWEPYYQGDKYGTGEVPGMGLGMATVAAFIWGVGGKCNFRNRPDQPGVIVELTLPVVKVPERRQPRL